MRPTDKLALIDKIGRELQSRFRYDEIDTYLAEYKIETPGNISYNSKWLYSKEALQGVSTDLLLKIAEDLDMEVTARHLATAIPPRNWDGTTQFRLFISHIAKDKDKAKRLKDCLVRYAINAFVAHEDIYPTLDWQREIERALNAMDAFIAIHTKGFSQSFWTQQEIGFAVGRDAKIISLKMDEDPTGFISKQQALSRGSRTAEQIAKEVDTILAADDRTAAKLQAAKMANSLADDDKIPF